MERETKEIELSNGDKVTIYSYLTWGEKETIQNIYISGTVS